MDLGIKTGAKLAEVFAALPAGVTTVYWGDAKLNKLYEKSKQPSKSLPGNISMQVLGGFMAAVGCAAVATAFILLNAATFGVAGLVGSRVRSNVYSCRSWVVCCWHLPQQARNTQWVFS